MSGGTPMQNAVLLTLVVLVAVGIVLAVVIGRGRRAHATGAAEAGSVRSRRQAHEIADRVHGLCSRDGDGSTGNGSTGNGSTGGGPTSVTIRVRGAARLLRVLRADDRYAVTERGSGQRYWSFAVAVPAGADPEKAARGVVGVLSRNGVTALAPSDAH